MTNKTLSKRKGNPNDEWMTTMADIEAECGRYEDQFRGRSIYCNCDDPFISCFYLYFRQNFQKLGLSTLLCSCYSENGRGSFAVYDGKRTEIIKMLDGNGSFDREECISLLEQADIVITNPPFSKIIPFINLLMEHKKQFLILGPASLINRAEIFPYLMKGKMRLGYCNGKKQFVTPNGKAQTASLGNVVWYTNLNVHKARLVFNATYAGNEDKYLCFDNYPEAINVDRVKDIPCDYDGPICVPVTYMYDHDPVQFDILGANLPMYDAQLGIGRVGEGWIKDYKEQGGKGHYTANMHVLVLHDKGRARAVYRRIVIQRKKQQTKADDNSEQPVPGIFE
jgi:hypothetical protein